jgi:hypothetical protein
VCAQWRQQKTPACRSLADSSWSTPNPRLSENCCAAAVTPLEQPHLELGARPAVELFRCDEGNWGRSKRALKEHHKSLKETISVALFYRKSFVLLVPRGGLEPPRPCGLRILSPLRLPISPSGLFRRSWCTGPCSALSQYCTTTGLLPTAAPLYSRGPNCLWPVLCCRKFVNFGPAATGAHGGDSCRQTSYLRAQVSSTATMTPSHRKCSKVQPAACISGCS